MLGAFVDLLGLPRDSNIPLKRNLPLKDYSKPEEDVRYVP